MNRQPGVSERLLTLILVCVATAIAILLCVLVHMARGQPTVEYLGEGATLDAGTYLLKGEQAWLAEQGASNIYPLDCSTKGFGWVTVDMGFVAPLGAWRFSELRDPDAVIGTCRTTQQVDIGSAGAGDVVQCVGVDHGNNGNGDILLHAQAADWGGVLASWPSGQGEPAIAEARLPSGFNGMASLYIIGDGSSLWWCEVLQATPRPTPSPWPSTTPTATFVPTRIDATYTPTPEVYRFWLPVMRDA